MEQISMFEEMYEDFKFDRNKEITVLETFAGIGSQRKALDRLAKELNLKTKYLAPVEFDKYAIASYNAIHGTNHETKDITKTKGEEYGEIDIFTYSFPCQDISLAGKQRGFSKDSQTRSGLLWEIERILKEMKHKPKVLLMENVKNLLSEQFMGDFQEWVRELEKLGYMNYYKVLNAKDYGIPQNRERVFMISILGEFNYTFPQPSPLKLRLKDMLENEVDEKYYLSEKLINCFNSDGTGNYPRGERFRQNISSGTKEIANALITTEGNKPTCNFILEELTELEKQMITEDGNIKRYIDSDVIDQFNDGDCADISFPNGYNKGNRVYKGYAPCITGTTVKSLITKTIIGGTQKHAAKNYDGISPCLTSAMGLGGGHIPFHNYGLRIRKLTPKECLRLMGFQDEDYNKMKSVNVSDSQIYKQAGNSIVVDVLYYIFKQLFLKI